MDDKKVIDVIDAEIARRCILIRFSNRHGKLWGKRLRRIRIASAHQTRPDRHADTKHPFGDAFAFRRCRWQVCLTLALLSMT